MSEQEKVANRFRAIELARELGSVTEACRQTNISRSRFYVYLDRYQREGQKGLHDGESRPNTFGRATSEEVVRLVVDTSLRNPRWSAQSLIEFLATNENKKISKPTLLKILQRQNLSTVENRARHLEALVRAQEIVPTIAQLDVIGQFFANYRLRPLSEAPGKYLYAARIRVAANVRVNVVIDSFSSYAFASFSWDRTRKATDRLLRTTVCPAYRSWGLQIGALLLHDPRSNHQPPEIAGIVERLQGPLLHAFDGFEFGKPVASLIEQNSELAKWILAYNNRPVHGYPNWGTTPWDVIVRHRKSNKL